MAGTLGVSITTTAAPFARLFAAQREKQSDRVATRAFSDPKTSSIDPADW